MELLDELESISKSISNWSGLIDEKKIINSFISRICQIGSSVEYQEYEDKTLQVFLNSCQLIDNCLHLLNPEDPLSPQLLNECLTYSLNIFKFCQSIQLNETRESQSKELSKIFQTSYQHLKVFLLKFDQIIDLHWSKIDFKIIIIQGLTILIDCSLILCCLDISACIPIWKQVKKFLSQSGDNLSIEKSKLLTPSLYNSFTITNKAMKEFEIITEKKDNGSIDIARRTEKIIKFMLSMNLQIIIKFKESCYIESTKNVLDVIILVQKYIILTTELQNEESSLRESFSLILKALVKEFIQLPHASKCVNGFIMSNGSSNRHGLLNPLLLVCTEILASLGSSSDCKTYELWFDCHSPDSCCILKTMIEVLLPQNLDDLHRVSFINSDADTPYKQLLVNSCYCIAMLPQKHFSVLEDTLLNGLLDTSSNNVALYITDLWCFCARWGSSELCWQHFQFLGNLLMHCGSTNVVPRLRISVLFKRLFWFLPSTLHVRIPSAFPPSAPSTALIWSTISVWDLSVENQDALANEICRSFIDAMAMPDDGNGQVMQDQQIANITDTVIKLSSDPKFHNIDDEIKRKVLEHALDFWISFEQVDSTIEINEGLVVAMLQLIVNLFSFLEPPVFVQVLWCVRKVLLAIESQAFKLKCCKMLAAFKSVTFPESIKSRCFGELTPMFHHLLLSDSWLVHTYAMKALKDYAELTSYPHTVTSFLPPKAKKEFTKFLKKHHHLEKVAAKEIHRMTFKALTTDEKQLNNNEDEIFKQPCDQQQDSTNNKMNHLPVDTNLCKKMKLDDKLHSNLQQHKDITMKHIIIIEREVEQLCQIHHRISSTTTSVEVKQKIETIVDKLNCLISNKEDTQP